MCWWAVISWKPLNSNWWWMLNDFILHSASAASASHKPESEAELRDLDSDLTSSKTYSFISEASVIPRALRCLNSALAGVCRFKVNKEKVLIWETLQRSRWYKLFLQCFLWTIHTNRCFDSFNLVSIRKVKDFDHCGPENVFSNLQVLRLDSNRLTPKEE